jgi:hypothetical protein
VVKTARRTVAFDDYKRNVEKMKIYNVCMYEERLKKKFLSIDQEMKEKILGLLSE